jgi:hypothetical protein
LLKCFGLKYDTGLLADLSYAGLVDGGVTIFLSAPRESIVARPGIVLVLVSFDEQDRLFRPAAKDDADRSLRFGRN